MYVPKSIELLYLRFLRHKTVFGLSIILFSAITLFFPLIYPGEESMQNIVIYYERFVGELEYDNPGFHIWTIIAAGMVISIYLPLSAILLGVNILPIAEKDGKELLFSTPKSLTREFLENSILLTGLIWLICTPSYLLSIFFLLINNNADSVVNLTISFVIGGFLTIFIAFLTAFGCSISFSKKIGYLIGGGYTVIGFFSDMAFRNNKDFEALLDLNLFSRAQNTQNAIMGTWNEEFLLLTLLLSIILIILSILLIHRKDFIEGGYKKSIIDEPEIESQKITKKLSIIKLPLDKLIGSLGWRFPALRDQLHSMVGIMTVFLIVTIGLTIMQGGTYEGEVKTAATFASIDIPFIDAALFNYELKPTFEGWFTLEFFAWAWMIPFGPFILIVINNIIFRDKKERIAEITWVLPQSETKIIFNRTMAALIGLMTLFFGSFLTFILVDFGLENNGDLVNAAASYLIFMWGYCVFFIVFLALALLVPYRHAQKTLLLGFTISILLLLAGFIADNFLLLALTPFSYFDYMGVFLGEKALIDVLPNALICTCIAIVFYIVVLKKVVSARDRLVQ
ncbi:MAG: hypothetical protein ACFFBQ_19800 [Promethearchaeota archaeon]